MNSSKYQELREDILGINTGESEEIQNLLISDDEKGSDETIFVVDKYDDLCDEHFKIDKIVTMKISKCAFFIFMILDKFFGFTFDLLFQWFPKFETFLYYKRVPIEKATHVAVYGMDKKYYLLKLNVDKIPIISNENIVLDSLAFSDFSYSFTFKLFHYVYNPRVHAFTSVHFDIKVSNDNIHSDLIRGLTPKEYEYQRMLYGECDLNIKINSIIKLFFLEFADPFYMFQVFSVTLWYCNDYATYATVIVIMTAFSLIMGIYETRKNLVSVQQLAKYSVPVSIYRRNALSSDTTDIRKNVPSTELVPGDIFTIPEDGKALPCDCILLTGTVIVNEAMLTGESTPIIKSHLPNIKKKFDSEEDKKYFLFAGTKIVQKRSSENTPVLGLVYSTGFNTVKGNLIRSILYPKETESKFESDSIKFIYIMGVLAIIGFGISFPYLLRTYKDNKLEIVLKSLDLITTTVPPSLPACLGIGITTAISRLKSSKILCINRDRVNIAGKINMIVFDKTGTLTEDSLNILEYLPTKIQFSSSLKEKGKTHTICFDRRVTDAHECSVEVFEYYKIKSKDPSKKEKKKELKQLFVECLATCHGITKVEGKLVGDPIDVNMFENVGWILMENVKDETSNFDPLVSTFVRPKEEKDLNARMKELNDSNFVGDNENNEAEAGDEIDDLLLTNYKLGIVRRFDFSSKLQRMSTIVKNINEPYFKGYVKGSPEKIKELCKPDTIPEDFNEQLARYASKGLRVLALGAKVMSMDFVQSQEVSREFVESNLTFLGLLVVQNKLKKETPGSIQALDEAKIKMVMATGDNILTAISVSRECKLISPTGTVYSCEFSDEKGEEKILNWSTVDNFKEEPDQEENIPEEIGTSVLSQEELGDISWILPQEIEDAKEGEENKEMANLNRRALRRKKQKKQEEDQIDIDKLNFEVTKVPFNKDQNNIIIAITGKTFELIQKLDKLYLEKKEIGGSSVVKLKEFHDTFRIILRYCSIYARMSPEHKTLLVESLKKEKFTVLMCGDGANDCGALKAAHVGMSLSTEEASIAAPFTSQEPNISCLLKLLREGKASLVTSIQTFKYMMLYSITQFSCVTILMVYSSYLSDWQFLSCDLFIIVPLAFCIPRTQAYHKLTYHQPTGDLISFPLISSLLIQIFIVIGYQLGGMLLLKLIYTDYSRQSCDHYMDHPEEKEYGDEKFCSCVDDSLLFYITNFQYLLTAITLSISKPFKKPIYTNYLFITFAFIGFSASTLLILYQDKPKETGFPMVLLRFHDILQDALFNNKSEIKIPFKFVLLLYCISNIIVSWLAESFLSPCLNKWWNKRKMRRITKKVESSEMEYDLNLIRKVKDFANATNSKK